MSLYIKAGLVQCHYRKKSSLPPVPVDFTTFHIFVFGRLQIRFTTRRLPIYILILLLSRFKGILSKVD